MSMRDAIKNFSKQFELNPEIENGGKLRFFDTFIICGMGGSHLSADILSLINPHLRISVHEDYGLPTLPHEVLSQSLIIVSSYSGNTEEALSSYEEAVSRKLPVAVISLGGRLLEFAKRDGSPFIKLPDMNLQPRMALGLSIRALMKFMRQEDALKESKEFALKFFPDEYEEDGKNLAEKFKGKVPIIYSSRKNFPIALNWKIKFNESGKIPAFANFFPELNHNEMTGFDANSRVRPYYVVGSDPTMVEREKLNMPFHFIFLRDAEDDPRILKRMEITEKLYRDRGLPVEILELQGDNKYHKVFASLLLADWTAFYTAEQYGLESEQVPMVEEFKKLIT